MNRLPNETSAIKLEGTLRNVDEIPGSIMVIGEDEYLQNHSIDVLKAYFLKKGGEIEKFDAEITDLLTCLDSISNLSMFSSRKLSIIYNADKINIADEKRRFEELVFTSDNDRLIVFVTSKLDGRTSVAKILNKIPKIDCKKMKPHILKDWCTGYLKEKSIRIKDKLLDEIIYEYSDNTALLVSEFDKMLLYLPKDGEFKEELLNLMSPNFKASSYDFVNAIMERKVLKAWDYLNNIELYKGLQNESMLILTALYKEFVKLFRIKAYMAANVSKQEIANKMFLKEYLLASYINNSSKWDYNELKLACILIADLDKDLKLLNVNSIFLWKNFIIELLNEKVVA
ncbi:MAG: DNA polymerase III subunit delta [Candidatus Coatesbacteria bacterium]|nr:DNA polymerase III subunit delta [Candidatus Coatesbacteria bacterium]